MSDVLGKPEVVDTGDTLLAKYSAQLDGDGDGVASIKAGIFVELVKKEALDEAVQKVVKSGAPDWLKKALSQQ